MYKCIKKSHLQHQSWNNEVNPKIEDEVCAIFRAICGTIDSGNQAEVAIRREASKLQTEYPQILYTIINKIYVNDGIICGDDGSELKYEVEAVWDKIGFNSKCVTTSGPEIPSSEKTSLIESTIGVARYYYEPKKGLVYSAYEKCNLNRAIRGIEAPNKHPVKFGNDINENMIPKLTRVQHFNKLTECINP